MKKQTVLWWLEVWIVGGALVALSIVLLAWLMTNGG